jgi:hypothetical protein
MLVGGLAVVALLGLGLLARGFQFTSQGAGRGGDPTYPTYPTAAGAEARGERVWTAAELEAEGAAGSGSGRLLLAILGEVYDVSAGGRHYAAGAGYSCFAGRDGSRAFVTGEFEGAGLTDDVAGLDPSELEGVLSWRDFYRGEAKYPRVGVLVGRYYDRGGARVTGMLERLEAAVAEAQAAEAEVKEAFPPCNSRWTQDASQVITNIKTGATTVRRTLARPLRAAPSIIL